MIEFNLNKITNDMARINNQISSGRQMSKISDNPVNLVRALGLRSTLAEINQYSSNISFGDSMIAAAESSLTGIKELVSEAMTETNMALNDSQTAETRTLIAPKVQALLEQSVTLANTRYDGKYVFGGYRTTGYTDTEPTPFMLGYIDGYRISGNPFPVQESMFSGTVGATDLLAGDMLINGQDLGAVNLNTGVITDGLNMDGANNMKTAVNVTAVGPPPVTATLTTLYAGNAETATGNPTDVSVIFTNGATTTNITYTTTGATPAADAVTAINQYSEQTGVKAELGDGTNGGAAGTVVLSNTLAGDESDINITVTEAANPLGPAAATSGLVTGIHSVGAGANTGQISFQSTEAFELTSTNVTDDSILNIFGWGGGGVGVADEAGDGILVNGYRLNPTELEINGIPVDIIADDGISDVYGMSSAEAKATAINRISQDWVNGSGQTIPGTGVTAEVTPVFRQATSPVVAGTLNPGDLVINGVDIFTAGAEIIVDQDTDNVLINAINSHQATTGVVATRNSMGHIGLKAIDGRNLHIETSAMGNYLTHINGATAGPGDRVYSGQIQLLSDRTFMMESSLLSPYPPGGEEPGFTAIGVSGGSMTTGEPTDTANDGKLSILSLAQLESNVRYTGDRDNNAEIKVGAKSKIAIAQNGEDAISDTGVFQKMKELGDYLLGNNYTFVTGIHAQDNIYTTLETLNDDEKPLEEKFVTGDFTITVTDHDIYPPLEQEMVIPVDITLDTPKSIADKINGIPGLSSQWDSSGQLHIDSSDSGRYTFKVDDDNSNTLNTFGINPYQLQTQGLTQSLADFEDVLTELSINISNFGARANRMTIQTQIYANLELANQTTLSEKQDTDLTKAILDLKSKEVAYQAALSAAARAMQLSLVDYL